MYLMYVYEQSIRGKVIELLCVQPHYLHITWDTQIHVYCNFKTDIAIDGVGHDCRITINANDI
jgi:hypothetical protein